MSHFVGRDVLTATLKDYFTKYGFKNTQLPDFIKCLQDAYGQSNIQRWTDSWLTKAGVNEVSVDTSKEGEIVVKQAEPRVGDKQLHEQVIQVKLFGEVSDCKIEQHVQKFKLLALPETLIKSEASFKPKAASINSGNLGYLRAILDKD